MTADVGRRTSEGRHAEQRAVVAMQFDDPAQEREARVFGMWVFLASEVMLFGALFLGYTVCRLIYPASFTAAARHLDVPLGSINTGVLLASSLTMALAVHAAQRGERRRLFGCLLATLFLGALFLGIKAVAYHHEFEEGLLPGPGFQWDGPGAAQAQLFFRFYFLMTGLHALHLALGVVAVAFLAGLARRGHFGPGEDTPVDLVGLYWHFVDIVWVFLLPALYLIH